MKRAVLVSLCTAIIAAALRYAAVRRQYLQWSAPIWLPVAVAFAGVFIGSFAVHAAIYFARKKR